MNMRPTVEDIPDRPTFDVEGGIMTIVAKTGDDAERQRVEAEAAAQRLLDEAMADTVELIRRHRVRLQRRVTSPSDGRIIRQIFALLRNMSSEEAKTTFGADT